MSTAAGLAAEATALAARGDHGAATALYEQGLIRFSNDARFINSAGNYFAKTGRDERAVDLFLRALRTDPALLEAAINAAIVMIRLDRASEAAALLRQYEKAGASQPRYWSTLGNAERASGDLGAAARSHDTALRIAPDNPSALAGRARTSLERGEARAIADHERALAQRPGDPQLIHDYAQALAGAGRQSEALALSSALTEQLPAWLPGLILHAGLMWAGGERSGFASHFEVAARKVPSPALFLAWSDVLAGVDRHVEAALVLEKARLQWPDDQDLTLSHAINLGEAGDGKRAEALFAVGRRPTASWDAARARNLLRLGDPQAAERLLAPIVAADLTDITAWALIDIAWRLTANPRHMWLHGQDGLVRQLDLAVGDLDAVRSVLADIHAGAGMPIGQSVKSGSQTRGALFARMEPQVAAFRAAVEDALAEYRAGLPPHDPTHPLLARRDDPWSITGSWSILLDGEGHHAPHIHPRGVISSASYLIVPDEVDDAERSGWLELGRPPTEMSIDLEPLRAVKPREASCVLFPSTLFHGTRPIRSGRRMTVAFDVTA